MSVNLSPVAVTEFDSMVKHAYQNASLLRDAVTVRNNVVGDTYKFRAMGKGTAAARGTTSTDVSPMNVAHSLVTATLTNFVAPEFTDIFDAAEVNFDEKQELAQTIAGALGRRLDQLVIDSMDAATPGATVGTGTTGLSPDDLVSAKIELVKAGVGSGDLFCVLNGKGLSDLLGAEKTSSSDYANVKALVNGEIDTFAGFKVITMEDRSEGGLTVDGSTAEVKAYAFAKDAVGLAIGVDNKTTIDYIPEKVSFLCNGMLKAGAAIRDTAGLVEINYDNVAA
jgi:hypothetical protein|tara:strand:+ start:186 stop:1028 length:843 start_codon:yes stop_codon:yes gene_type:complete